MSPEWRCRKWGILSLSPLVQPHIGDQRHKGETHTSARIHKVLSEGKTGIQMKNAATVFSAAPDREHSPLLTGASESNGLPSVWLLEG
jgi:hypothetical protein